MFTFCGTACGAPCSGKREQDEIKITPRQNSSYAISEADSIPLEARRLMPEHLSTTLHVAADASAAPKPLSDLNSKPPLKMAHTKDSRKSAPLVSQTACCGLLGFKKSAPSKDQAAVVRAPSAPTLLESLRSAETAPQAVVKLAPLPDLVPEAMKPESKLRPDLRGRWKQMRVEGDMEQLMMDAGVSWTVRRLAKSMGYGVGQTFATISQEDAGASWNSVAILQEIPTKKPTTMKFSVGKPFWQETVGADGNPVLVQAVWDKDTLVVYSKTLEGKTFPVSRRWLDSKTGELVLCQETSKGEQVLRIFAKQ